MIPLLDVVGNADTVAPEQILVGKLNVGIVRGVTVILIVRGKPHWPAAGVNVYEPLAVLLTIEGLHVPVIPLFDVVGNIGAVVPEQKGAIAANEGTMIGFDKITPEKRVVAHPFAVKINPAYTPAFNPVITAWPDPFATITTGPAELPSSV